LPREAKTFVGDGVTVASIKGSGAGGDYRRMLQGGDVSERREVSGSLPQAHETINRTERRPAPPRPNLDEDDEDFGSEAEDISENFGRPQKRTKGLGTDMDDGEEDVAYKKAATTGQGRDQDEDEEDDEDKDENDDDDDDDEMAVLLEYERIKKSREEKERKEKEAKYENLTTEEQEEIIKGNPIFDNSYSLDKRWYEETVFRNQAKTEPKAKKRSINDTVRSDFHKKFLKKYIWT
jgi:protein CWC15